MVNKCLKKRSSSTSHDDFMEGISTLPDLDLHILPSEHRVSAVQLSKQILNQRHLLVDVRNEQEFQMCKIDGAVNAPIDKLRGVVFEDLLNDIRGYDEVTFVCRRGNDSQIVAKMALDSLHEEHRHKIKDLTGGLHSWSKDVDKNFPIY